MPKKNSLDIPQEKILMEETQPQQPELTKPKRQISDAQRDPFGAFLDRGGRECEGKNRDLGVKSW